MNNYQMERLQYLDQELRLHPDTIKLQQLHSIQKQPEVIQRQLIEECFGAGYFQQFKMYLEDDMILKYSDPNALQYMQTVSQFKAVQEGFQQDQINKLAKKFTIVK